jgi:hypothetical protein
VEDSNRTIVVLIRVLKKYVERLGLDSSMSKQECVKGCFESSNGSYISILNRNSFTS